MNRYIYTLVRVSKNGEKQCLMTSTNLYRITREMSEMNWSSIQNTGNERKDLKIIAYERIDS